MKRLAPLRWFFRRTMDSPECCRLSLRLLRMLFGLETTGSLPKQRPLILVGNHASYYDGIFMTAIMRDMAGEWPAVLAWRGMLRYFPTRDLLLSGAMTFVTVPELRGDIVGRIGVFRRLVEVLRAGQSICVFPEGDVLPRLGPFRQGAVFASLKTGSPLVPFSLCGTEMLWKTLPFPHRFWGRVSVHLHPPIDPAGYRALAPLEAAQAITAELRKRVASAIDYPDGCRAADSS